MIDLKVPIIKTIQEQQKSNKVKHMNLLCIQIFYHCNNNNNERHSKYLTSRTNERGKYQRVT